VGNAHRSRWLGTRDWHDAASGKSRDIKPEIAEQAATYLASVSALTPIPLTVPTQMPGDTKPSSQDHESWSDDALK